MFDLLLQLSEDMKEIKNHREETNSDLEEIKSDLANVKELTKALKETEKLETENREKILEMAEESRQSEARNKETMAEMRRELQDEIKGIRNEIIREIRTKNKPETEREFPAIGNPTQEVRQDKLNFANAARSPPRREEIVKLKTPPKVILIQSPQEVMKIVASNIGIKNVTDDKIRELSNIENKHRDSASRVWYSQDYAPARLLLVKRFLSQKLKYRPNEILIKNVRMCQKGESGVLWFESQGW